MTPIEVVDIAREAIWVLLKVAAPVMLIALGATAGASAALYTTRHHSLHSHHVSTHLSHLWTQDLSSSLPDRPSRTRCA